MPARAGGKAYLKVVSASVTMFARVFTRVLGTQLLSDVSSFVSALETMFGGFRQRAEQTYELLKTPGTAFVVVASPEPDALREASYFVERLSAERMPLAGLVLNRVRRTVLDATGPTLSAARAEAAADALGAKTGDTATTLAEAALRVHSEVAQAAEHDGRMARRFAAAHPEVPIVAVPALAADVHDLDGLRTIGSMLADEVPAA
jgi:anion-transporting  ArsA/GET3 family ATPase